MPNPKLNTRDTIARFPDDVESRHGIPTFNLFSPQDVALRENQLRLAEAELDLGPRIPAHYLLYGAGSPATREQSRIGGLPYRPRGLEWPKDDGGRPREFVCQIDFSDSEKLLSDLPGQIMLLFASQDGGESPFILEWYPAGLRDLMTARDLPKFDFTFPMREGTPVWCSLYETFDYPEAATRIEGTRFAEWKSFGAPCGSKIGGFCESCPPGHKHILTIESVQFFLDDPYPFVCAEGKPLRSAVNKLLWRVSGRFANRKVFRNPCYNLLMIGDMGRIQIFKDTSGKIVATDESY